MLRRVATVALVSAVLAAPAHAQGTELMPGVTFEKTVEFTPNGPVVVDVLTAPRPGGLYQLAPVLGLGAITGGPEKLTQIEESVSSLATVAGINGDFFDAKTGVPAGTVIQNGALEHTPYGTRSSIGVDTSGTLHVDRLKLFATWQGTGQRRPLNEINDVPATGDTALFTPAYGAAAPKVSGSVDVVLDPFPSAVPNTDLSATVTATGSGGGEAIPPDGAVLMATGAAAPHLQAEAPVGTRTTERLITQPSWPGVVAGIGGGPQIVKNGKPVFRSGEAFPTAQVTARSPRAGIGQLADGRIVLVAVDGDQPGYSSGLSTFELAQTMTQLGAVTASAVGSGTAVTEAFDGQLLDRPSAGQQPVKEGLLVEYFGVYASALPVPVVNGDPGQTTEPLSYKIVRPSTVTAKLVAPDGTSDVLENAVQHVPGSYTFTAPALTVEGTWHWNVTATDDTGQTSTIDRTFRYDTTLSGLTAPKVATGTAAIRFTLSRPATVKLQVETQSGIVIETLPTASLQAGAQSLTWDGTLTTGTRAYAGTYVAHVFVTSSVGTSDLSVPFSYKRG
ncbi:MAG TPA: phosphodiester glycosidase family protein [Gaiellaceae bacterium]|nr:phosphodiester glycosidase family protein [Gaiellaceae bacterium]